MMKPWEYSWRHLVLLPLAVAWFITIDPRRVAPWALVVCAVMFVAGELIRVWATGHLRKDEVLTVSGPYRYVRNPMYVGTLLIATSLMLAGGQHVLLIVFLAIFFLYYMPRKQRREGRRLLRNFGMDYAKYVVGVNSLVPMLKPYAGGSSEKFSLRQAIRNNEHQAALSLMLAVGALVIKLFWGRPWMFLPEWVMRYL